MLVLPVSALLAVPVPPAAAGQGRGPGRAAEVARTVTLVTGDRVEMRGGAVRVRPGPGRGDVGFIQQSAGSHVVVLPADAARLVAKGRLDRRLFDVGRLVAAGQDDARAATLPLAVTGSAKTRLPGIRTTGRDTVSLAKKSATRFWHALAAAPGDIAVRPVGLPGPRRHARQAEFDLKADLLDRNGRAPGPDSMAEWVAYSLDDPSGIYAGPAGEAMRLPTGRYMVFGTVTTPRPGNAAPSYAGMVDTEVVLDRDRAITFDARKARRVEATTDRPSARKTAWMVDLLAKAAPGADYGYYTFRLNMPPGAEAYASTTAPSNRFAFGVHATYQEPLLRLQVGGAKPFPVDVAYAEGGANDPRLEGTNKLQAVYGGGGTPEELHDVKGKLVVLAPPPADDPETAERVRNVARAGGRAVLLVRDTPGPYFDGDLALPTAVSGAPDGARLRDLAKAGPVPVTTRGVAASPYQYNLYYPTSGRVPADAVRTARGRDLAAVRVHYRGADGPLPSSLLTEPVDVAGPSGGWAVQIPAPTTRTEYFTTGKGVRFSRQLRSSYYDGRPLVQTETRAYRRGERREETMNKGVAGPSFATPPRDENPAPRPAWAFRDGDTVDVAIPTFSDAEPGHYGFGEPSAPGCTRGSARLSKDGAPVGESDAPAAGTFTAPPGAGAYRLDVEAACDHPDWRLSTKVTSSWTFRSAHTSRAAALPLMAVRFLPELDDLNRAPAGKPFSFPVRVEHQPGAASARVVSVTVEASADGGGQWRPVRLREDGDHWVADVQNPSGGKVSLRATARDADGNTVTQVIENAYAVTR
ncbi:hypothetical protein ACFQHO_28535 [Actinomadura yumaensis]|uniref:hypothetical protein n=1 Tax=Actinomadura TaxID=1988 RepID=UPI00132CA4C7|nr:hypothetical protein [Actinomadura sp. J1-007]MWK34151.1 hypothetical protein [Actinomadura sp. J1-007]